MGEIAQICPVIVLCIHPGVLTPDILRLDECFHAPGSLEMEEIVRGSRSMKPTDNEIWLGFYKDKIRSASHLRGDYRPLRIGRAAEAGLASVAAAAHTNKVDRTRDPFKMMDHELVATTEQGMLGFGFNLVGVVQKDLTHTRFIIVMLACC